MATKKEIAKKITTLLKEIHESSDPDFSKIDEAISLIKDNGMEDDFKPGLMVLQMLSSLAGEVKREGERRNTYKEATKEEVEEECDCLSCQVRRAKENGEEPQSVLEKMIAEVKAEKAEQEMQQKEFEEASKKATGNLVFTIVKTDDGMDVRLEAEDFTNIELLASIEIFRKEILNNID